MTLLFLILLSTDNFSAETPDLLVIKMHHDQCNTCIKLEPRFQSLKKSFANKSVLFATIDQTNSETKNQSSLLAGALGLGDTLKSYQGIGYLLVIDAESKSVLAKLTDDDSTETMTEKIQQKL